MTEHSHGDYETRSTVDLAKAGVHVYASHPSTAPWCFAWTIAEEEIDLWTPHAPGPIARLFDFIAQGGVFVAHNAAFELAIWNLLMAPRFGWPTLPIEQVRCTMAMAYALALPGSLENAAAAVGLDIGKDMEGRAVMMQLSRPRKIHTDDNEAANEIRSVWGLAALYRNAGDTETADRYSARASQLLDQYKKNFTWWDTPEKLARVYGYCKNDVAVERKLEKRLLPLSSAEQRLWVLDQQVNNRGVYIDMPAVDRAMGVVEDATARLNGRMALLTAGDVKTCSQVQALKEWIEEKGVAVDGLAKADLADLLARTDLPTEVRAALLLRQEAAKSSTAKLKSMRACSNDDNRARGLHQFCAAGTGRWGGRRLQTQNFPRSTIPQDDIDAVLALLADEDTMADFL